MAKHTKKIASEKIISAVANKVLVYLFTEMSASFFRRNAGSSLLLLSTYGAIQYHGGLNNSKQALCEELMLDSLAPSPADNFKRYSDTDVHMKSILRKDAAKHVMNILQGENKIEAYEIYKKMDADEIYCIIKFGDSICGYPGVVHGGITALLFDQSFGWLMLSANKPLAVTAYLNVTYK